LAEHLETDWCRGRLASELGVRSTSPRRPTPPWKITVARKVAKCPGSSIRPCGDSWAC